MRLEPTRTTPIRNQWKGGRFRAGLKRHRRMYYISFLLLFLIVGCACNARRSIYRKNSRTLRRLSRNYDWELDEHGGLRPIINPAKNLR
ncbi:hypothetical protein NECAME_15518 [Necator americanus]|uniref:Uncharacterized protein n=1 Tax=Necator americanus TaxID=51031 RepID=W2SJP0_NECAM|nr:hypothetical protein NECAME_15518 [Necator americanus]ETN69106.1 hypothetical protein NECAME_15518 [Necator americanus]